MISAEGNGSGEDFLCWARTAVVSLLVFALAGFTASAQNQPTLGEVARQTRKQRTPTNEQPSTPAAAAANRLAAELEQEQEEDGNAPAGFQSYSGEGYRVSVPAPFSIEGRDDAGVLLATADVTGITTKVFVASPIAVTGRLEELEFQELARRFWGRYGSIDCSKATAGVPGHRCTVGGNLLGNQFFGQARFVEGDRRIVPVICFATSLVRNDLDYSIRRRTREELDNLRDDGLRNRGRSEAAYASNQLCGAVLESIRLREEHSHMPAAAVRAQPEKASLTPYREVAARGTSLGDIARQSKEKASQQEKAHVAVEAEDTINAPPPGFRVRSTMRCEQQCWQESFFLPENARHVKGGNSDNVYVAMLDKDTSVVIYFGGTTVSGGYSEYGMAQDLARRWLHAQGDWGADVTHFTRTVNGHEVKILRARLAANLNVWTELDVIVAADGINFNIGCIARDDRFSDAESMCSTVWESWRIHK